MLPPPRPRINQGSSFTNGVNRVTDEYRFSRVVPKLSNLNFALTLPHRTIFHEVIPPFPGSDSMSTLGMRDVEPWLKSLRLHKYTALFQEMTYDQMMSLDENTLEQEHVTKGARKKILQSIEKLIQRPAILRENEQMLFMGAGKRCVNCAIVCLLQTLGTPIHPYRSTNSKSIDTPCIKIQDQNLPENQERTRSEQRTIYQNLVSLSNLPSLPKGFFDLDLTAQYVVANQQLILLLMQGQQGLLQQQQQRSKKSTHGPITLTHSINHNHQFGIRIILSLGLSLNQDLVMDWPFTLPETRQENSLFSDSLQMTIGTWNGAAAEEAKKRLYEPFSPCDSISGYSSPGTDIPQVDVNWIYGHGAH
ncbi:unnamed protein product, partial [Mesorhabditis belari]|uniref:SAM domain-containing protein n=1 Tax=Mesorhabditis belari TaxID=2138241 RepID=A0AAF3F5D3_9BILA